MDSINNACKLGSDAWLELQEFKNRQLSRREKLNRHRDLINGIALNQNKTSTTTAPLLSSTQRAPTTSAPSSSHLARNLTINNNHAQTQADCHLPQASSDNPHPELNPEFASLKASCSKQSTVTNCGPSLLELELDCNQPKSLLSTYSKLCNDLSSTKSTTNFKASVDPQLQQHDADQKLPVSLEIAECLLLLKLCDVALKLPIDSRALLRSITKVRGLESLSKSQLENLLQKLSHQELITIDEPTGILSRNLKKQSDIDEDDESCVYVTSADHTKLVEFDKSFGSLDNIKALFVESRYEDTVASALVLDDTLVGNQPNSAQHSGNLNSDSYKQKLVSNKTFEQDDRSIYSRDSAVIKVSGDEPTRTTTSHNLKKKNVGDDLESLLSLSSTRERESKKLGEELLELLSKPTVKERNLMERFRSADGYQVQEFCPKGTKGECNRKNNGAGPCAKLHFKKIIAKHTEESLGDCSFLNTCFHMDSCKYVHYEVDYGKRTLQLSKKFRKSTDSASNAPVLSAKSTQDVKDSSQSYSPSIQDKNNNNCSKIASKGHDFMIKSTNLIQNTTKSTIAQMTSTGMRDTLPSTSISLDGKIRKRFKTILHPPQWIQCDLRFFDMSLLGKFSVVMADPPWDIHMELPYGTMSDDEMRKLNIPALQDEGVIFLWVTGRAMELGRECLALWGYERCDEIIWVKTNQLQRIIRTGRTGHWLNHGKEHCLVGVKGNPTDINRGLDCDVIVAEVRATSHKPDEIYGIIERLSPGTRKIELFGRAHNVQPNWITLGNQLNGVKLIEPDLVDAFKKSDIPFETDNP